MIERQFVKQKIREFQVEEDVTNQLGKVGHSHTKLQRTPLGEKIVIHTSRPGLVVGRKGQNIKKLTIMLKEKYHFENPQLETVEVENIFLNAQIVAENIAASLEKFGTERFKGIGHKMLENVMRAGAKGVEILISGRIPGARAKRWRFYQGYLKKCGDPALTDVLTAYSVANLKIGSVGIQVRIMPPNVRLPDNITLIEQPQFEEENEEK